MGRMRSFPAGVLTESTQVAGSISREDVASLCLKALFSKKADGKVLACFDKAKAYGPVPYEEIKL